MTSLLLVFVVYSIYAPATYATTNVKTWLPTADIFDRQNQLDFEINGCSRVEFGKINTADILLPKLRAHEFVLPVSGQLLLLDGGGLEILDDQTRESDCLKLKEFHWYHFWDPSNWEGAESGNPAVPDVEKIPCRYDTVKFPKGLKSGAASIDNTAAVETVSRLEIGGSAFDAADFDAFKSTDVGSALFSDSSSFLSVSAKICDDISGCVCRPANPTFCPQEALTSSRDRCTNPVKPTGFCHEVCGAYLTFHPLRGFLLQRIKEALREYDVFTHVSKISDNKVQVVFGERDYEGRTTKYAQDFYKKLSENAKDYKIVELSKLENSQPAPMHGGFWGVFWTSLIFVVGLFGVIFCVYGDFKVTGFVAPSSLPLSATYRARFDSTDEDSGRLIFDQQGSVMDLSGSFENPVYGQVSTRPDLGDDEIADDAKEMIAAKIVSDVAKPNTNSSGDPLSDLDRLNTELREEMAADVADSLKEIPVPLIDAPSFAFSDD